MKFLIYPAVDENELQEIQSVSSEVDVLNIANEDQALEIIGEVDAMYGRITPELLANAKKLRWIQTPMAGLEHYMFPALAESDVTLSNMQGIYSDNIADHVMGYILMFARGFHIFLRRQLERNWAKQVPVPTSCGYNTWSHRAWRDRDRGGKTGRGSRNARHCNERGRD